ncbi:glutamate racemase [Acidovorax sp. DW039]|uniref:glutamate racemase n=1 Tax=Acidovorax sp. DW039 TaxID=3095606 RepID=UPI0030D52241
MASDQTGPGSPQAGHQKPIGVFDSGVGGLSVLKALQAELPHERFVYLADSANAPYGERGDSYVAARTHAISDYLLRTHGIKALVVACNTATAAAIHEVRSAHPTLPLVGVEPALKPAVAATRTGRIGVIGTRGTLGSTKFNKLLDSVRSQASWVVQPCDGLAHAIERSVAPPPSDAEGPDVGATETGALCTKYLQAMGKFGKSPGQIDTLVLGCTHYIFVAHELRALAGPHVQLIETGQPVARQTRRLLESAGLLSPENQQTTQSAELRLLTTGAVEMLEAAALRWMGISSDQCQHVAV